MDSRLKTLLIILAFVVVTILVFKPFQSCGNNKDLLSSVPTQEKECYNPSFDSKYIDPRVSPYSKDIAFRPDTGAVYGLDDTVNSDPDKLFDHLSDQNQGLNVYDNIIDTDPLHNNVNLRREYVAQREKHHRRMKHLGYNSNESNGTREHMTSETMRSKPMTSSYTNTEIDNDIINESNNIAGYCTSLTPVTGAMADDKETVLPDGVDRPYSAIINDIDELGMDMDNKQYYDMISGRPEYKTYIQIDENFGRFNQNAGDSRVKDINGLADITQVMDAYRNDTLYSISGGYKNSKSAVGTETKKNKMYDTVI